MEMEACQNLTLPSTSDVDVVVKDSNPIQISGAEEKVAVSPILAEPLGAIGQFVGARVGKGSLMANFHQPEGAGRRHPRVSSLLEIAVDHGKLVWKPVHMSRPTNPVALGAGATLTVNVKTVRPCFVVCHTGINDEGFLLQL